MIISPSHENKVAIDWPIYYTTTWLPHLTVLQNLKKAIWKSLTLVSMAEINIFEILSNGMSGLKVKFWNMYIEFNF